MQNIFAQSLLKCRLCWRITFGVFVLILAVESVLLIPSAHRFTQIETQRIAKRTQMTVDPALMLGGGLNGQGPLARDLATLAGQYQLKCVLVRAADGSEIARTGDVSIISAQGTKPAVIGGEPTFTTAGENMLLVSWKSLALGEPMVTTCVDITYIHSELIDYLLRIKGMVLIIVMVVTAGTMLLLYFALLKPILQLRQSAIAAGEAPKQAAQFILPTARRDELGDLIGAHNALLTHVTASMQREAAQADEREKYVARHDPVTRLPNRVALKEYLQRLSTDSDLTRLSLFLIELTEAHSPTADVQKKFSAELEQLASSRDLVAQLGPTQFALLRCGDERQQRIHSASIAESIVRAGRTHTSGAYTGEVRIGVVEAEANAIDADTLLAQAEFALNRARTDVTTQYQFFDNQSAEAARDRQLLTRELDAAIANRDLVIWYQPKFSLKTPGLLEGMEALVRWPHATRGMVSPAAFVPLAEATGLIEALDHYVFTAVCAQINLWTKQHAIVPRIGINIAAPTFASPLLADELQHTLEAAHVSPHHIEIEITESVAMRDVAQTGRALQALRALGIETAIDDFGTGYSSLSYLRHFEVDTLKIDRSFVEEIGRNVPSEKICAAIVQLGQALGTRVIAEGVETEAQAAFLRTHGCDQVQGYLFGKPLSAEQFAKTWLVAQTVSTNALSAGE